MSDRDTWIHLVAGGVGGTTGAIVTCPLEVVKTRLQSSNSGFETKLKVDTVTKELESTLGKSSKANWAGKVSHGVYRPALGSQYSWSVQLLNSNWGHFGSSTPILYSTQSQPCRPVGCKLSAFGDRTSAKIHTDVQTYTTTRQPRASLGVWTCLSHIWKNEGVKGLYRGLGPNLVGVAPSRAIYFWSYSTTKKRVNNSLPKINRDTPFVHVLSAASAGFVSSCATNPIWLIKTRLQLDRSHSSLPMVIRRIHAEGGMFSFWKGLTASWWGISETVIHFVIYEFLKKCLAEQQHKKKDADKTLLDFAGFMACGATSKTCATCVAYPHGTSSYTEAR
eukprot:GFUD01137542.1.p1 GENE.GFUD01137542.1~~GFUD01137542.1.p1  ORF type:complete len:335 (+),score=74.44 GFUD01137542.1:242-1246(+)